jgi:hypothetical protein
MVRKSRIRGGALTPKYITGLGDGHMEDINVRKKSPTDDEAVLQKAVQKRRSHPHHAAPQLQYSAGLSAAAAADPVVVIFPDQNSVHSSDTRLHDNLNSELYRSTMRRSSSPTYDPWEGQAMYLVAATMFVIITAVFLHLISEGHHASEHRIKSPHGTTVKRQRHAKIRKKKTDEWNEDSKEEDLLSESVRGGGGGGILELDGEEEAKLSLAQPAALYYPYQPRLPQQRHRRNSSSSNNAAANMAISSPQQPQQLGSITSNQSYYLNQSGSAVIPRQSPVVAHQRPTLHPGGSYCPPSPLPHPKLGVAKDTPLNPVPSHQSIFQTASVDSQHQRLGLHVRPLSTTASSFESLTEGLPVNRSSTEHPSPFSASHLGDGMETLTPISAQSNAHHNSFRPDYVDKTPRVANGRSILHVPVPEDVPLNVDSMSSSSHSRVLLQPLPSPIDQSLSATTDLDMLFATSPKMRKKQQQNDERPIPFVPSLAVPVAHTRPPKSMDVEDLHLYQLMELGTISHWEKRLAEENSQIESRVFPVGETNNNIRDSVFAASADLSDIEIVDSIPASDLRSNMVHKREDITEATDSTSSLQGAIDFNELKLVEVIGGGGFGQVWKAYWRGTPVAVKVLTGSAQSKRVPKPVLEEFAAEINLLMGMRHPNICQFMGACLEPPNRAIITELASNGSLWDALRLPLASPYVPCDGATRIGWPDYLYQPDTKHGAPPTPQTKPLSLTAIPPRGTWHWILVQRVAVGAARALSYLHGGKIPVLHRDLKSANILLDDSYAAKVCDFGLSRLKAQERSMTGNCGTVQWMVSSFKC